MVTVDIISEFLERFAPVRLAEEWDNVGLLVGDTSWPVQRVMTCLTVTPDTLQEATQEDADLIVTHHPLPFRPLKKLTSETIVGQMLLQLLRKRIAIYSPHTAFDSASAGINQLLAAGLELSDIRPLLPLDSESVEIGSGRWGTLPTTQSVSAFAEVVKQFLNVDGLHISGSLDRSIRVVGVACGSAGEFLEAARKAGCDALVIGETSFHTVLEAVAREITLFLPGHYASERFAVDSLANVLSSEFPQLQVWASRQEKDPQVWYS